MHALYVSILWKRTIEIKYIFTISDMNAVYVLVITVTALFPLLNFTNYNQKFIN